MLVNVQKALTAEFGKLKKKFSGVTHDKDFQSTADNLCQAVELLSQRLDIVE